MSGLVVALCGSYLVGSFPTGYVLVKWLKRVDVRTVGSGNVGATNVTRVAGFWSGILVFLVDAVKGAAAVSVVAPWLVHPVSPDVRLGCGLAAVLGHAFPIWLNFRGGKGVATTIGVLVAAMPSVAGICLAAWLVCFVVWRYVSAGSLAAAVVLPPAQWLTGQSQGEVLLGIALALLIIARHQANIARLLKGQEHRAGRRREA